MRILCCGNRDWPEYHSALRALQGIVQIYGHPECVIEGEARGADTFFRGAAEYLGIPVIGFPADWAGHRHGAGPLRNQQMLDEGRPTHLIALARTFTQWSGTMDMVFRADAAQVPMACLSSRDEVDEWVAHGCPFGSLATWLVNTPGRV